MQKIFFTTFIVIILDTSNKHIHLAKEIFTSYKLKRWMNRNFYIYLILTRHIDLDYHMLKILRTVLVLFGSRGKQDAYDCSDTNQFIL